MGKASSKHKSIKLSSKLPYTLTCPLCDENFTTTKTYNQFNQHLFRCGNILHKSKLLTSDVPSGINDEFQLVIDYNATTTQKIEEDKRINTTPQDFSSKITELQSFIKTKKAQMSQFNEIEASSIEDICFKIKNINIYDKITIKMKPSPNESPISMNLSQFLDQFFDFMIQKNLFSVINGKTLGFDFKKEVDWELLGIILAMIIIHDEIVIKFKFSALVCKMLLKQRLILNDIQYADIDLYEKLNKLTHDTDLDSLGIVYTANDDELIVGGKDLKVNENNLMDYIDKRVNYEATHYKDKISLIRKGVFGFIQEKEIMVFTGDEFYQIINRMI